MAQSAHIITAEDDDREDNSPAAPQQVGIPPDADVGILGTGANVPGSRQQVGRPELEPFEIVEVGSEDEQAPGPDAAAQTPAPADGDAQQSADGQEDPNQPRYGKKWSERQRRREGRERTLAENRALKQEVEALRQQMHGFTQNFETTIAPRIAELSEAQVRGQISQLDAQIGEADRTYTQAEDRYFEAMQQQDMQAARTFLRARDEALIRRTQLQGTKQQVERAVTERPTAPRRPEPNLASPQSGFQPRFEDGAQRPQPQRQEQQLPPEAVEFAQDFMRDIPWLNQPGTDRDSQVMRDLDAQVMQAGFDPSTPDYWDELMDRARTYIPHRFQPEGQPVRQQRQAAPAAARAPAQQQAPIRRGPPTGAPGNTGGTRPRNEVRITPERREALEQAGVIDSYGKVVDRKKFDRIALGYAEVDRASGTGR